MEQSDISQRGGWWKDWKKLVKEHICIYAKPMDTDNNVVKAEVGNRTWWKWRKVEKCWTSVIVSTINILQKEATFLELPKLI